jgi:hypothetical protein
MHRRPKLKEAIEVLNTLANKYKNEDAIDALHLYNSLRETDEFSASRMVVDIVDHYYHLLDLKGISHG